MLSPPSSHSGGHAPGTFLPGTMPGLSQTLELVSRPTLLCFCIRLSLWDPPRAGHWPPRILPAHREARRGAVARPWEGLLCALTLDKLSDELNGGKKPKQAVNHVTGHDMSVRSQE